MKMINLSFKVLLLATCVSALNVNSSVYADSYYDDSNCGDLLNCGSFNVLVHGGIAPTTWRGRGNFSAVSCLAAQIPNGAGPIVPFFQLPRFNKFFHLPWIVGGQIGYAVSDCSEVYVEFNYRQASKRSFALNNVAIPNDTINIALTFTNKYRAFDAYVGARAYWGRYWCDRIAFFLGGKFGLVHHKSVDFNYAFTPQSVPAQLALVSTASVPFFLRKTSPAGGANIGLDWGFGCGWSLVLMAEVVATCGPRSNANIPLTNTCTQLPSIVPSSLLIGNIATELFFPITLGLKYSF